MLTVLHWIYILGVLGVILGMIFRREVVLPCVIGTFLVGTFYHGSLIGGLKTIFESFMTGGIEIYQVTMIITVMVAMLKSMEVMVSVK